MNKAFYLTLLFSTLLFGQHQHHIPWPSLADSPWPVLRGDMQGTGRSQYVGPRTNNVVWRKDMPLGVLFGPVIGYDDILYMGERALSPDPVNYFYAVDKDGNDIWTFETPSYLPNNSGAIVASDSTIYFFSRNHKMYALNPDGSLKWEQNIWANFRPFYPVAKNGDIYVSLVDTIVVVSPEGIMKDTLLIPDVSPAIVFSTGGDTIFFISGRMFTQDRKAINAATIDGNLMWSIEFDHHNWGIPAVDNNNRIYVYGGEGSNLFLNCINPDGTINWRYLLDPGETFENYSSPTIDVNGNIIFQTSSLDSGYIISVDYHGNQNWKTTLGHYYEDGAFINHGLVSDAEGKIYCGSSLGLTTNFWCLDSTGAILWTLDLGGYEYDSCPAIGSDGTLYIGTHISSLFQNHQQNLIAVRDEVTVVENPLTAVLNYSLEQNYPNPFNPITHIRFGLPQPSRVKIEVFNILGERVSTLLNTHKTAGYHVIDFDGSNLASGIYVYRIQTGEFVESKKMILLR